ncbi:hypothetical protein FNJ87_12955 [Nonlabens mediterrranea]|uniref:GLPGLI family protein n=1 Tax=Nonlabens mediterrranea TaxID=1419947 RepID=A0ABS0A1N6_9FLAO|nr:hypothetical protein [Nonlabens mediterrranea]MBF4985198.1 hypothetical protein [Nonlabens mediterrranea]
MKKVLIFVVLLSFAFAKAQTYSSKIIPNDTMLLRGYIDEYPITMYIENVGFCEYEQKFTGWYKYDNSIESIPIVFFYSPYPEEEPFRIYAKYDGEFETEVNEDYFCQVLSYDEVFETTAENGNFNDLKWRKKDADKLMNVWFEGDPQDQFWELGSQEVYLTRDEQIILDLGVLDFEYAYDVEVLGYKNVEDISHLLLEVSVPSKPGGNGRGMCGGGEEIHILYLRLDDNNRLIYSDQAKVSSCYVEIDETAITYDAAFPEKGFTRSN